MLSMKRRNKKVCLHFLAQDFPVKLLQPWKQRTTTQILKLIYIQGYASSTGSAGSAGSADSAGSACSACSAGSAGSVD